MSKGSVLGIMALAANLEASGRGMAAADYRQKAGSLLVNGYNIPAPGRVLNQRQKRKRARW